jgi:hypothetical protein
MKPDSHMDPDEFQQAWQAQSSQTRVTVDADLLLKQIQRNQRDFRATILRRDIIEVGVGLLMLPYWFYQGITSSLPWTWYLTVPAIIWVIGFFLVDRMRHPQTPSDPSEPLLRCVTTSLTQVEHQIWLLRNVFWWYLLPFAISILAFFTHVAWSSSESLLVALAVATPLVLFLVAIYSFVDYINQRAVRVDLEPRRQELLALLASLGGDDSAKEHVTVSSAKNDKSTRILRRWLIVAITCLLTLAVIVLASGIFDSGPDQSYEYPKKSPFAAVRWNDSQPEVKVGDEWFKLLSLDSLSTTEIVAFSQQTYGNQWRKRFEEDLVELLIRMDHPPQDTVKLVVQSLASEETQILEDIPMTEANRQAIKEAAVRRENSEP